MNFFEHQDQARKKIRWLMLLFIVAVLTILVVANTVVMFGLLFVMHPGQEAVRLLLAGQIHFSLSASLLTTTLVLSTVIVAVIVKNASLRNGVQALAESLGGRLIPPTTTEPQERCVLNIVAEMAIASGMPVPDVYVLKWEKGINAFSAGHSPSDAVIGVTAGCLAQFDRAQLQGVIAHEFSHILNGDMRLNMRLIAILFGITFIAQMGYQLLRLTSVGAGTRVTKVTGRTTVILLLLAGVLIAVGSLGFFLGGLIRAALTRQREYLADAFAVQFTRNPDGIKEALLITGGYDEGSEIFNIHAIEASHLFFSNALLKTSILTRTHPPLAKRIKRLAPAWDGRYIYRKSESYEKARAVTRVRRSVKGPSDSSVLSVLAAGIFSAGALPDYQARTITQVSQAVREPLSAILLCYAILLNVLPTINAIQKGHLQKRLQAGTMRELQALEKMITPLPPESRVALLELSFPGLRRLSRAQYIEFKQNLKLLIKADENVSLFEWCVFQLIKHYLDKAFGLSREKILQNRKIKEVSEDFRIVLSMLVYEGTHDANWRGRAFGVGANSVGLYNLELVPKEALLIDDFSRAVTRLSECVPALKDQMVRAMAATARFDRQLGVMERTIITTVAAAMDAPLGDTLINATSEKTKNVSAFFSV